MQPPSRTEVESLKACGSNLAGSCGGLGQYCLLEVLSAEEAWTLQQGHTSCCIGGHIKVRAMHLSKRGPPVEKEGLSL